MKKANLFSLNISVREDGRLAFDYDYVKPEIFVKTINEVYPEFENTHTLASIIRLCVDNSEYLSSELIKLGRVT
jgi:hypothetical protein|tara:strand:- start:336 stop:557 length:222 start_codon:yes stop_codon:yes gene_type:complete